MAVGKAANAGNAGKLGSALRKGRRLREQNAPGDVYKGLGGKDNRAIISCVGGMRGFNVQRTRPAAGCQDQEEDA